MHPDLGGKQLKNNSKMFKYFFSKSSHLLFQRSLHFIEGGFISAFLPSRSDPGGFPQCGFLESNSQETFSISYISLNRTVGSILLYISWNQTVRSILLYTLESNSWKHSFIYLLESNSQKYSLIYLGIEQLEAISYMSQSQIF